MFAVVVGLFLAGSNGERGSELLPAGWAWFVVLVFCWLIIGYLLFY